MRVRFNSPFNKILITKLNNLRDELSYHHYVAIEEDGLGKIL